MVIPVYDSWRAQGLCLVLGFWVLCFGLGDGECVWLLGWG